MVVTLSFSSGLRFCDQTDSLLQLVPTVTVCSGFHWLRYDNSRDHVGPHILFFT
jgi:hypothetical protein